MKGDTSAAYGREYAALSVDQIEVIQVGLLLHQRNELADLRGSVGDFLRTLAAHPTHQVHKLGDRILRGQRLIGTVVDDVNEIVPVGAVKFKDIRGTRSAAST